MEPSPSLGRYASPLIDLIDPDQVVRRRYFRDSCTLAPADGGEAGGGAGGSSGGAGGGDAAEAGAGGGGGRYLKDLREAVPPEHWPERALLVDNSPCAYDHTCPRNGVPVRSWYGTDPNDRELLYLLPFLAALSAVGDVRSVLGLRTQQPAAVAGLLRAAVGAAAAGTAAAAAAGPSPGLYPGLFPEGGSKKGR